jgi:2',3'-cyclic-nucleotide 2'-phosphodiesterase (5'-nucleotidase family)
MNAQKRLKAEHLMKAMATMDLDAVGLNDWDLAQGPDEVARLVEWLGQPVVATNVDLPAVVPSLRSKELTVRGRSVGVLSFLDPALVTGDHGWITVRPWEDERPLVADLAGRTDLLIAMVAIPDSTRLVSFAETFPEFHLVVGTHRGELPATLTKVGRAGVIGGGSQGRYLGRVEVDFDASGEPTEVRGRFLQVLERWGRRPWTDAVVTEYNRRLRTLLLEGSGPGEK